MISPTGVWSKEEADIAHVFSYGVARWIGKYLPKDKKVIDLGCGRGTYLQYLNDVGFKKLTGVDGSVNIDFDFPVLPFDLSEPIYLKSKGNVISLETWEHLPAQYESLFIDNIVRHCTDKLILSCAVPGQPGLGHVNCQTNEYVIECMEERGFKFLPKETASIRACAESHVDYFRNTLMVFEKIKA